ncbi:MAG: 2-oxo-4-hydroxy-4-carboxy-5-ureidoimidazoline decarboxylase [Akkermansiaceae bacterium]|jgi:2-oxo-4-hydroxy-4-carboxy-5-ureidoimidazoline decarboxylase|nr:2-oxo-4-hydroxy-4-carboxy-5-ureidoimidazoline decarboxylase [Akkermansiaceae bacterium]MDP4722069.1 2-oxo-4-hydroxy-4-carboxy-5-ureidoimidazoline decarboxylase [Akkermansiaceae bacterium]MDP4781431.1 2-oxo-4-hydroxy-4-carboxy-5-ureidoimidazoline decarboxylase [Akkermansiaceae bacterium]MDP4848064.1 2-oxo-4-hydroxy-4-carboxy-5-ureidoimidazoline decarboxylase [Akkermansiaceae bacterium]MDP4899081.1 2-oxo-4-hydroxy-4-carboxy-5-ureidoimidazoline decarboxylase [Akkermansiaceae bacterium]
MNGLPRDAAATHGGGQVGGFVEDTNMTISEMNAMGKEDFLEKFGGVYEHSAWVAEAVVDERPFGGFEQLVGRMREVVDAAAGEAKLELLLAHPDLAGKLGLEELTEDSRKEQQGVGLDRLDKEEFELFTGLNEAYRGLFGFPFIICVGKTDKAGILRSFQERLLNSREDEVASALSEVHEIARLRVRAISG